MATVRDWLMLKFHMVNCSVEYGYPIDDYFRPLVEPIARLIIGSLGGDSE